MRRFFDIASLKLLSPIIHTQNSARASVANGGWRYRLSTLQSLAVFANFLYPLDKGWGCRWYCACRPWRDCVVLNGPQSRHPCLADRKLLLHFLHFRHPWRSSPTSFVHWTKGGVTIRVCACHPWRDFVVLFRPQPGHPCPGDRKLLLHFRHFRHPWRSSPTSFVHWAKGLAHPPALRGWVLCGGHSNAGFR